MAQRHPIAKFLCYDIPKQMFKDLFHLENEKGKTILEQKIKILEDMEIKEVLTKAKIFENIHKWSAIVYFNTEMPRYDADQKVYKYDAAAPGSFIKMRAYPSTCITIMEYDMAGEPSKLKIEVQNVKNMSRFFIVDRSRFTPVCTRIKDEKFGGLSVLEPIWDYLVYDTWLTYNMAERGAREGSGYKHVTFKEMTDRDSLDDLADEFMGSSSSKGAFTSEHVLIDEKGYGGYAVNWTAYTDILLDRAAIGSGYPKDIMKGIQSGRVTGGEVNEKGVYAAIHESQVDMIPVIKDIIRKLFPDMKNKYYIIKFNLNFRMTDKDMAETEKIKADTKAVELAWKDKNEIRELDGLPPVKEEKPVLPEQQQLPGQEQKLLPPPKQLPAPKTDFRQDYFNEGIGNTNSNGTVLKVPVVLAREGVYEYKEHNTTEYISYDELVKAAKYTPAIPIVLDQHVPIGSESLSNQAGIVRNIRGDNKGKKLIGDAYFFLDKTPQEYITELQNNRKIEGSVGKKIGSFGEPGVFSGRNYDAEQKDIKMTHYAVSLKFTGKCSTEMGCGINQI